MKFIITSNQYSDKVLYAATGAMGWSENRADAYEYDERDQPSRKLAYWQAHANMRGLDAGFVVIQEIS